MRIALRVLSAGVIALSCLSGGPAWAHAARVAGYYVTRMVPTTVTVPVYGWVLTGSRPYQVIESRDTMAVGPAGIAGQGGQANAFSSGFAMGSGGRAAQSLTLARQLARADKAKGGSAGGALAGSPLLGTWYGQAGKQGEFVVVVGTDQVTISPNVPGATVIPLSLDAVTFDQVSADGQSVRMSLVQPVATIPFITLELTRRQS